MPNSLSITFHADNWDDLTKQMRLALGREPVDTPAPTEAVRSYTDFPADGEALEPDDPDAVATEPEPDPEPAPPPKRSHKAKPPAAPTAATEPAPPLAAKRDLPPLDVLKGAVTRAVRAAQKKEGPTKILDLLPGFKKATGLDFVMSAEDKHRPALLELAEAADLELA